MAMARTLVIEGDTPPPSPATPPSMKRSSGPVQQRPDHLLLRSWGSPDLVELFEPDRSPVGAPEIGLRPHFEGTAKDLSADLKNCELQNERTTAGRNPWFFLARMRVGAQTRAALAAPHASPHALPDDLLCGYFLVPSSLRSEEPVAPRAGELAAHRTALGPCLNANLPDTLRPGGLAKGQCPPPDTQSPSGWRL